jgi:hypothetical protein
MNARMIPNISIKHLYLNIIAKHSKDINDARGDPRFFEHLAYSKGR